MPSNLHVCVQVALDGDVRRHVTNGTLYVGEDYQIAIRGGDDFDTSGPGIERRSEVSRLLDIREGLMSLLSAVNSELATLTRPSPVGPHDEPEDEPHGENCDHCAHDVNGRLSAAETPYDSATARMADRAVMATDESGDWDAHPLLCPCVMCRYGAEIEQKRAGR